MVGFLLLLLEGLVVFFLFLVVVVWEVFEGFLVLW